MKFPLTAIAALHGSAAMCAPAASSSNVVQVPVEVFLQGQWAVLDINGVTLKLLLDTGSSDTYVMGNGSCIGPCDFGPDGYTGYDDPQWVPTTPAMVGEVQYADGTTANLTMGNAPLGLGGQNYTLQFGVENSAPEPQQYGTFALGYIRLETFTLNYGRPYNNILADLVRQGKVNRLAFGLGGDQLVLGGYDANRVASDWTYLPLYDKFQNNTPIYRYDTALNGIDIAFANGSSSSLYPANTGAWIEYDTGASALTIPQQALETVRAYVDGDQRDDDNDYMYVDCQHPNLAATISTSVVGLNGAITTFPIKLSDLIVPLSDTSDGGASGKCQLLVWWAPLAPDSYSLGTNIMQNYYWIFDQDANAIKVANLKNPTSTSYNIKEFSKITA